MSTVVFGFLEDQFHNEPFFEILFLKTSDFPVKGLSSKNCYSVELSSLSVISGPFL